MHLDGTRQHALDTIPAETGFNPRWSPDGSKMGLLRYDGSERARMDPALPMPADWPLLQVVVVDVATGTVTDVGPRVARRLQPGVVDAGRDRAADQPYDDGP